MNEEEYEQGGGDEYSQGGYEESSDAFTPSPDEITATENAEGDDLSALYGFNPDKETIEFGEEGNTGRYLPRERIDPLLEQVQRFAPYRELIDNIEQQGGIDTLQSAFAQQEQERQRLEMERQDSELTATLEAEADQMVADGRLDPELIPTFVALAKKAASFDQLTSQQQQQSAEQKLQSDVASVLKDYPNADPYAVEYALRRGEDPRQREEQRKKAFDLAVQNEATRRGAGTQRLANTPVPMGGIGTGGGPIRQVPAPPEPGTAAFEAYNNRLKSQAWDNKYGHRTH